MESMDDYIEQIQQTNQSLTIEATADNTSQIQSEVFEIKQTNVVTIDKRIESSVISNDNLDKIKTLCYKAEEIQFPLTELFLGIATLFAGATISAIISGINFEMGWKALLFYVVSPMISVGCYVAYYFLRKNENVTKKELAHYVLEHLPRDKETDQ